MIIKINKTNMINVINILNWINMIKMINGTNDNMTKVQQNTITNMTMTKYKKRQQ